MAHSWTALLFQWKWKWMWEKRDRKAFIRRPSSTMGLLLHLDDLHKPFLSFYSCTNHRFLFLQLCTPFCRLLRLLSQFLLEKSKGLLFARFWSHVFFVCQILGWKLCQQNYKYGVYMAILSKTIICNSFAEKENVYDVAFYIQDFWLRDDLCIQRLMQTQIGQNKTFLW